MGADRYLVVKTVDVTDAPLAVSLKVVFSHDTDVVQTWGSDTVSTLNAQAPTGVLEVLVPDGTNRIHVEVTPPDPFWPATQDLKVDISATPPTIDYVGGQGMNTDLLAVHSRGTSDFNLEVPFVIGQVVDATDKVTSKTADLNARSGDYTNVPASQQGLSFETPPITKSRFGTPIVGGGGTGIDLLNHTSATIDFKGKLFFVERKTTPKLVAVVHPGWDPPETLADAVKTPIPFHVFYSPVPTWFDAYPYGATYLDFAYRYLLQGYPQGHGMLYQNNADSPKVVFVFPMSHAESVWVGDVATEQGLTRLLEEVSYYLQRKLGASWPLQEVGSVSLSCYSAGIRPLSGLVKGGDPDFLEKTLKNVFIFDGVFAGDSGADETNAFCKTLAGWFKNQSGRTDRNLRVYTQQSRWFDQLQKYLKLDVTATAIGGAREADSDACTLACLPMAFWMAANQAYSDFWFVHFSFPSLFMEHAVTHSTF